MPGSAGRMRKRTARKSCHAPCPYPIQDGHDFAFRKLTVALALDLSTVEQGLFPPGRKDQPEIIDTTKQFESRVSFIELAALRDSTLLIPAIAQQLGVQERGAPLREETLALAIGDRKMLLVLDNLEQILPAATSISRLLAHCPHLKTLITSRAALQIRGEHRFSLAPLAVPDLDSRSDLAEAISYPAVALFCQRAQAIRPDFTLQTQEDAHVVAQLCRCLDGLPLAIDLAAARLKIFSLQDMLARLTSAQNASPLDVLSGRIQDVPERQQSARTAIQWSYDLLNAEEQQVFHAMRLFENSALLAALRAVSRYDEEALLALPGLHLVSAETHWNTNRNQRRLHGVRLCVSRKGNRR